MGAAAKTPTTHPLRAAQATIGIVLAGIGVGAHDWGAGVALVGILFLATSGLWMVQR